MSANELVFKLTTESKCPLYNEGDIFKLSGNALLKKVEEEKTFITTSIVRLPDSKQNCPILVGDFNNLLINYEKIDRIPSAEIQCSGCEGAIRLQPERQTGRQPSTTGEFRLQNKEAVTSFLSNLPIFRSLSGHDIRVILPLLKLKRFVKEKVVIRKGESARHFYIILAGAVEVLDEQNACLSKLAKGDIFGEMSLISGDAVGATIKVAETAVVALITEEDFKSLLNKYPSVQMFLTRNLTKRLTESNTLRTEEIASGMSGKLSELPALELLQALNLSQKTGVLTLSISEGSATLFLRDGNLLSVLYKDFEGKQALCEALKEKEGRFKFVPNLPDDQKDAPVMGPMMEILLDTSRMLDEQS